MLHSIPFSSSPCQYRAGNQDTHPVKSRYSRLYIPEKVSLDIKYSVQTSGKSERQLTACQPPENGCRLSKIRIYRMRIVICAAVLYILPSAGRHHHRRRVRRCGWNRPVCQGQVGQSRYMLCKGQESCPGHGERWTREREVRQMGYW